MKIVQAIHCCVPGGAEIFVKELLLNAKKIYPEHTYQLWVIHDAVDIIENKEAALSFEKQYIEELENNGICVKKLQKKKGLQHRIQLYQKIRNFYKEFKPDVIHTHLENTTFHICTALLFKRVPIVQTIHNEKIGHKHINKYFLSKRTKHILSIADKVTESIENHIQCKKEKIIKIYNGVNVEKFSTTRKFEEQNKALKMVAVGRLTKQKNYTFVLEAWKELMVLCQRQGKVLPVLEIYGQGEEKQKLEAYVQNNEIQNVTFMGVTQNVNEVLKHADVYIMGSIFEGFSISLIEAVISGIAIVCTDVGGNREILGDTAGILVESNHMEQMKTALYSVLDKEKRKQLYAECLKRRETFDIQICVQKHMEVYENSIRG